MATQIKIIDSEKPKGPLFKQKWCSQSILNSTVWLLLQVVSSIEKK